MLTNSPADWAEVGLAVVGLFVGSGVIGAGVMGNSEGESDGDGKGALVGPGLGLTVGFGCKYRIVEKGVREWCISISREKEEYNRLTVGSSV